MAKFVTALFDDSTMAGNAVADLKGKGYTDSISIVAKDENNHVTTTDAQGNSEDLSDGTTTGATIGAATAGIGALLAGVTATALPGSILVTGPIASALTAGAAGALTGGLVGALVDAGIPDEQANMYSESIAKGQVLVSATVNEEDFEDVMRELNNHGATEVYSSEAK